MTDLIHRPHAVTRVELEPYRALVYLADGLHVVIESLQDIHLDGNDTPATDATALDTLTGSTVQSITTSDTGTLTITTTAGHTVTVPADPDYEAWSLVGASTGILAVALPGGGVGLWT